MVAEAREPRLGRRAPAGRSTGGAGDRRARVVRPPGARPGPERELRSATSELEGILGQAPRDAVPFRLGCTTAADLGRETAGRKPFAGGDTRISCAPLGSEARFAQGRVRYKGVRHR
jgi:hypothetical protein